MINFYILLSRYKIIIKRGQCIKMSTEMFEIVYKRYATFAL